ncbi:MAG: MmcB family DNA repair protein [Ahrensia sp.]
MPIISAYESNPLDDGRQSDRALAVRRGVQRLLDDLGLAHVPEVTLANGRRADIVALGKDGAIWIIEVKSSVADLRADNKWPDYRDFCDRLYFATLPDVPAEIFPQDAGFIVADSLGAAMIRDASTHKLSAARRKAMTLRFARQAAMRLHHAELLHGRSVDS